MSDKVYCWQDPNRENPWKGRKAQGIEERVIVALRACHTPMERAATYGHIQSTNGMSNARAKAAWWLVDQEQIDLNFECPVEQREFLREFADAVEGATL